VRSGFAAWFLVLPLVLPAASHADDARPDLEVASAEAGCPSVTGRFVALLRADRGMLLLSAAPFTGGVRIGEARGGAARVVPRDSAPWSLDHVASSAGFGPLFGAVYPFRGAATSGCVGVENGRFSSEGDLVTFFEFLVDDVYLELPASERQRFPSFHLGEREVRLEVARAGFAPIDLADREGSTLAFRFPDAPRTYLLRPYVIDAASGRVAVKVATTDAAMWMSAPKVELGMVVAAPGAPVATGEPPFTISVLSVGR
jgi:hypothetical protein